MYTNWQSLKKVTKKRLEESLIKLNVDEEYPKQYRLLFEKDMIEIRDTHDNGWTFVSSELDVIENHLVISFSLYKKMLFVFQKNRSTGTNQKTLDEHRILVPYEENQEESIIELFEEMKCYWEAYATLKKYKGLLLVQSEDLHSDWVSSFIRMNIETAQHKYDKYVSADIGLSVFYSIYSDELVEKMTKFQEAEKILRDVMLENPMFHIYEVEGLMLGEAFVSYASATMKLYFVNQSYDNLYIENKISGKTMIVPVKKKDVLTSLHEIKEEQKLLNLIEPPMNRFQDVMEGVGVVQGDTNLAYEFKREFSKLNVAFGDWEHVESQMGEVFLSMVKDEKIEPVKVYKKENDLRELLLYKFQTRKYFFQFAVLRQGVLGSIEDFHIFYSHERENVELLKYLNYNKYIQTI